jgi:hypothetical protein
MTIFRNTYLVLDFNPDAPLEKRKLKRFGDLLDIVFETIRMVYPGLGSQPIEIPPRVRVPDGSHPFPGEVS